ncbi:MAG: putative integral membrane protein [Candidatus Accumulibacter adjunctus]|uniref:Integral membrane protein n=1 Tax=Candidatus Accumulibacter adjunctus TaxID=1454001 RepID=A0A011NKA1_9PROT|nr:MAG: putative integral membrane protein [Candidatus Accumulibacter adjunctus]
MEQFPIPAPQFDGASRRLEAGSVFDWFRQGWAIFAANPAVWIAMMVLLIVIYVGLAVVPVIGYLAGYLLTPLLAAGMLLACRKAVSGEALEIGDLFAGFRRDTGALMTLGVFYMLAMLLLFLLVFLSLGGGIAGGLVLANPLGVGIALGGIAVAGLIWLLLSLLIVMAVWFAPALVVFNGMPPTAALKASFHACMKNLPCLLVYGLLTMILCFFAALPLGLGFLVLGPVLAGSVYASYRDTFMTA